MALTDSGGGRNILQHNGGVALGRVTLAGTCKLGDPIGYSAGWVRAACEGPIQPRFIALSDGVSGDSIPVCTEATIEGFTAGTVGGILFLKNGTAGQWSEVVSATGGETSTKCGIILTATKVHARIDPSGASDTAV